MIWSHSSWLMDLNISVNKPLAICIYCCGIKRNYWRSPTFRTSNDRWSILAVRISKLDRFGYFVSDISLWTIGLYSLNLQLLLYVMVSYLLRGLKVGLNIFLYPWTPLSYCNAENVSVSVEINLKSRDLENEEWHSSCPTR